MRYSILQSDSSDEDSDDESDNRVNNNNCSQDNDQGEDQDEDEEEDDDFVVEDEDGDEDEDEDEDTDDWIDIEHWGSNLENQNKILFGKIKNNKVYISHSNLNTENLIWLQNNCVKISIFLPNFVTREGFITKVNDEYIIVRGALNKDFYDMDGNAIDIQNLQISQGDLFFCY